MPLPVARVAPSQSADAKWEVTLPTGRTLAFGQRSFDDFTTHGDPHRMLRYLLRHGVGRPAYDALKDKPAATVLREARRLRTSAREDWQDPATRGFWSRWLLWSEPTLAAAAARAGREAGYRVIVARRPRSKARAR